MRCPPVGTDRPLALFVTAAPSSLAPSLLPQVAELLYARYADDLVILVNNDRRQDWLVEAVDRRVREELAKLDVRLNEEKSRAVNLSRGESFGFLGFDFQRVRPLRGPQPLTSRPESGSANLLLRVPHAAIQHFAPSPASRA